MPFRSCRCFLPSSRWLTLGCILAAALPGRTAAQQMAAVADTSPFRPLDLPTPTTVRTGAGRPGPATGSSGPTTGSTPRSIPPPESSAGSETIHYVNRSPDALPYLWLHVEQNICAPGERHQPARPAAARLPGLGVRLLLPGLRRRAHARVARIAGPAGHPDASTAPRCGSTCARPLAAGAGAGHRPRLALPVPPYGAGRMGHDGDAVRAGAVVSAHGGVRRRAGLESRALHRRRASSTSSTAASTSAITVPADYVVAATGHAAESARRC